MSGERFKMIAAVISGGGRFLGRFGGSREDGDATAASGMTSVARER